MISFSPLDGRSSSASGSRDTRPEQVGRRSSLLAALIASAVTGYFPDGMPVPVTLTRPERTVVVRSHGLDFSFHSIASSLFPSLYLSLSFSLSTLSRERFSVIEVTLPTGKSYARAICSLNSVKPKQYLTDARTHLFIAICSASVLN